MRTLIYGAKGQLGKDLVALFSDHGEVRGEDLPELDISDESAVMEIAEAFRPELVINAAGYTDVEGAEDDSENAFRVNETGARYVARAATAMRCPVVYYSTDYVFGGSKSTPYEPGDTIAPIGVYARSKYAGEQATQEECSDHFILRTSWLYGPGGNNFVEKIIRAAQTRPELKVVDDEFGAPTYTWSLAEATWALVQTEAYGLYHLVNEGSCSRYEFAKEILHRADIQTPIHRCASDEFPTKAERPLYSVLSNQKLIDACAYIPPHWKTALDQYFQNR